MTLLPALDGVHGDHLDAVVVDGEEATWTELARRADVTATRLGGAAAVAVGATATLETVVAIVAGLRAGVPVVPVPADVGTTERRHILRDSGAEAVVGVPDWPDVDLPTVPVASPSDSSTAAPIDVDEDATALIVYTSGTTGPPKGAALSRRALAADLDGLADAWSWTPADTLVHGLPLFHVHGLVLGVLGALRVGSKLVHTGRPTPERYAAVPGTLYFGVPTVWTRVVRDAAHARALRSARLLVSGSAPLPVSVFEALHGLTGLAPIERYGMTETLITLSTRADGERRPGHVGTPITGVETRLRTDDGEPVPHDGETIGGLEVRGTTMFDGYHGQPEATAAAFTDDGWFTTGDAATVGPDGFHRIVGRASLDVIKCGGFKVGAGEIEAAVLEFPGVDEVAVVGAPDPDLGERIVAYVVGDGVDPEALIGHVAQQLSAHKRPRDVRFVDALPRNAMGKVQKQLLR